MATATGTERPADVPRTSEGQPSVLAILVTHRGREWIRDTLVGLNMQTYPHLDVLVIDDASPDPKKDPRLKRIAKRHLNRRRWGFVRTPRPLGFGGAINWAMSRVRTDADLLLFIHDDAALDPDAVAHMVERMEADPSTAVVGPKVVAWDDPQRLEEVGMAADRFGYPYKGLEEDEIDLGQHDVPSESFYVTSTCMLMRHDVFRSLRGWDARLRAFAEDLDLCWRARLEGHNVKVEPRARVRHAMGLATGQRESPFEPARYFIRRNRLRIVTKNASTLRLVALIPQFVLLTLAEMIAFIVLRQPREIVSLGRALGWNLVRLPQTLSERARVQKRRRISDRKLRRLTVRQGTRVRSYVAGQRDRLEEAWGRRADLVAERTNQARVVSTQLKGWIGAAGVASLLALLIGFRHVWWSPPIAVGELLPYADNSMSIWSSFSAPWRAVGLGQQGWHPPALAILGVFPILTFGAAGAAQKLLILFLGVMAFVGGYRLVSDLVDRGGRVAAGAAYMLGAVGYSGVRTGSLGALVFGAAAPFVLLGLIRLAGWVRPPSWERGSAVARVALGGAVSAAFVPGSLFLYAIAALAVTTTRAFFVRGERVLRNLLFSFAGLLVSFLLLLPWSSTWLNEGAPFAELWGDRTWERYVASFADHGVTTAVLGQTPEGPAFFGISLTVLAVIAVVAAEGQRRRLALALWSVVVGLGLLVTLFSAGVVRPFVASPIEAGVLISLALAALAGLSVGAFRLDLPRRGFGWVHWATIAGFAAAIFFAGTGLGPALLGGEWDPGRGTDRATAREIEQIRNVIAGEAAGDGAFRALWIGDGWLPPATTTARTIEKHTVTGPRGLVLNDLFERTSGPADEDLARVLAAIELGYTDRGGALLGAFNIRFVVLDKKDDPAGWLAQRDLGLVRDEPRFSLLENRSYLERAAVYSELPVYVRAIADRDARATAVPQEVTIEPLDRRSAHRYRDEAAGANGVLFLAEAADRGWEAEFDDRKLERMSGGWGNAFEVPAHDQEGDLVVEFPRPLSDLVWFFVLLLAWIVVIGAAFARRKVEGPRARGIRR